MEKSTNRSGAVTSGGITMIHHYIDQEEKDGKYYAVSWL